MKIKEILKENNFNRSCFAEQPFLIVDKNGKFVKFDIIIDEKYHNIKIDTIIGDDYEKNILDYIKDELY
ncbi:MAG: hypothetical protein ACRC4M_01115 [Mycoplasma sp.]